jgi:hypothetical protein
VKLPATVTINPKSPYIEYNVIDMTKQVVKYFLVVAIAATWSSTFAQKDIDVVTDRPRIVEDGGTGLYAAQMTIEGSLTRSSAHRIWKFFIKKSDCPLSFGVMARVPIHLGSI